MMEFIEFSIITRPLMHTDIIRRHQKPINRPRAKFYNARGERFMEKYEPEKKSWPNAGFWSTASIGRFRKAAVRYIWMQPAYGRKTFTFWKRLKKRALNQT
jgi:hypothetical protein